MGETVELVEEVSRVPRGFRDWKFNRELLGQRILRKVDLSPWPSLDEWEIRMLEWFSVECVELGVPLIIKISEFCPACESPDIWRAPWTTSKNGFKRMGACRICDEIFYDNMGVKNR